MRFMTQRPSCVCCEQVCRRVGGKLPSRLAAILSEKAEQLVHDLEPSRVDHGTPFTPYRHETSVTQPVEVEGQRIRREFQGSGDAARRHSFWPCLYQQAKDIQAKGCCIHQP
jgi:hypothetical protein